MSDKFNNVAERLFFALWPDNNIREHLHRLSQQTTQGVSGRLIPADNLHVTLVFIGDVDKLTKQCMQRVAATVQSKRFSLSLDKLGYWKKPRIFWLGASEIPVALSTLVTQLATGLQGCGYHPESRPYQVHITFMRDAVSVIQLPTIVPLAWQVNDFCLVRSVTERGGARYHVIERWPLSE
jgi:2'-5' RNA ligase